MSDLEKRVTELEVKFSLQEEFINELNQIVIRQKDEIDRMGEFLKTLNQSSNEGQSQLNLEDEVPPHY